MFTTGYEVSQFLMIFDTIGFQGYYSPWGSDQVEPVHFFDGVKHQSESQDVQNSIQPQND